MKQKIIKYVEELFSSKKIKGFLALRQTQNEERIAPHLFKNKIELNKISLGALDSFESSRYSLIKILVKLLTIYPKDSFGILVRGCDERAIERLSRDDRVESLDCKRIVLVGFSCSPELASRCVCEKPSPNSLLIKKKEIKNLSFCIEKEKEDLNDIEKWMTVLSRCVRCFGCRDVCPVCSCYECTLENENYISQRELPINRTFLITRAMHMVDRCVDCGLCEETCPSGIPLKKFYKFIRSLVGKEC